LKKALYRIKRKFIRFQEERKLYSLLKENNIFLQKYLEASRLTLEELYESKDNPLISVIIPTYNLGKILTERTIPSVLSQTYTNWELIIYGDVCTDDTEARIKKISDPRVKFFNLTGKIRLPGDEAYNRRFSNGWKPYMSALNDAAGRWIALFNDDDEFTPNHIEVLLRHAQETNAELVYANQVNVLEDGSRQQIGREGFPNGKLPLFRSCVPQRTVLMRSYLKPFLFAKVDYVPRLGFAGDMVWWEQMGLAGVRAEYLDKVVAIKHFGVKRSPAMPRTVESQTSISD
jgi:glycosyltransferase involved in cell wall biosynthesis